MQIKEGIEGKNMEINDDIFAQDQQQLFRTAPPALDFIRHQSKLILNKSFYLSQSDLLWDSAESKKSLPNSRLTLSKFPII